jgi:hypothetical protein
MSSPLLLGASVTSVYSPIGLQVIDAFLNALPIAPYEVSVDVRDGNQWLPTALQAVRTPTGVLTLPGLERRATVTAGMQPRQYRLRIDSDAYIPAYRRTLDGHEFLAFPYNDTNPPFLPGANVSLLLLTPAPAYGYPGDVRVLRGTLTEVNGTPIRDATIVYAPGHVEAMTDAGGHFALGLRHAPGSGTIAIDVHHDRTNRADIINLLLPTALQANQVITLN